jgi:ribosomal protein S18 acetylase RimI-like enzyme
LAEAPQPRIRQAVAADLAAVERIVRDSYLKYIERLGREPSTMSDDYGRHIADGTVWVYVEDDVVLGILVLLDKPDHLHLDNVAVAPAAQGRGVGRALIDFAENEARRRGFREVRLTTNPHMRENLAMYPRLGYRETGRGSEGVLEFVFFSKVL